MDSVLQHLWQEHINSTTKILHQLNKDVEAVKSKLSRESSHEQDNFYQSATIKQQSESNALFLKGGIARCDSAISKLVSDIQHQKSIISTQAEKLSQEEKLNQHISESLENQMEEMSLRLEKIENRRHEKISDVYLINNKHVYRIDAKIKRNVEEIQGLLRRNSKWAENERRRIEEQLMQLVDGNKNNSELKQEVFEDKILHRIDSIQRFVDQCKNECRKCREELRMTSDKNAAAQRLERLELEFFTEVSKLKKEYRDGFLSVKQSIGSTNHVVDGKIKLVKDQLLTDVHHLKRLTVLV